MIQLPNNCNCSGNTGDPKKGTKDELSISPQNWKTTSVSLKKDWYIHYYFRDPQFKVKYPKGKWVRVKGGINYFKTREERQEAVRILMAETLKQLKEEGYNPITNTFSPPFIEPEAEYEIDPDTPFLEALMKAKARLKISDHHHENIKSTLKYFSIAVRALKYDEIPIGQIKRKHIRFSLEHCEKVKEYWSNSLFNNYRRDLSQLFNELIQTETIEYNPCDKIDKRTTTPKIKKLLTLDERIKVDAELKASNYRLWRFMHIFYHSGSRISEMVNLQIGNIQVKQQEFQVLIKKGDVIKWVTKPIKDVILPLWIEALLEAIENGAAKTDYLFSKGLLSGPNSIRPEQITRRWKRWVKDKMGIEADFYYLKTMNSDETAAIANIAVAAEFNSHTTVRTTEQHYAPGESQRKLNRLKKINNTFV